MVWLDFYLVKNKYFKHFQACDYVDYTYSLQLVDIFIKYKS